MGSLGSITVDLPTIVLDTTIADLYRRGSPSHAGKLIAQVSCGVNSALELTSDFLRNAKYIYQDSPFNAVPQPNRDRSKVADRAKQLLKRELAVKYLSLIGQRDAFISGDTTVVLFHTNNNDTEHDRREAAATLSVLSKQQRPKLVFCSDPASIPVREEKIDLIACKLMLDGLQGFDLVMPPDVHWFLNSKAALARSGLPTPRCDIIEIDGHGGGAGHLCCGLCRDDDDDVLIPPTCEGARGRWFAAQSARVCDALAAHPIPFVVKLQQTFGGAGTYMIRNEAERSKLIRDFRAGVLRRLLSSVTEANCHMRPAAIVLSDLVAEPVGDFGLTFFVTEDDNPIFLAVSEQIIADDKAWVGSTINYARQDELKTKFGGLVWDVARWLRRYNYIGPVGSDVLETRPQANDTTTTTTNGHHDSATTEEKEAMSTKNFHIVDLNVRTSGSLCLPLLRSHFTQRGLQSAFSLSIKSSQTRDEFVYRFRREFAAGKMCIISWYEDPVSRVSWADLAVGVKGEEELEGEMQRIRDATEEVTF